MVMAILETRNLSKTYGRGDVAVCALRGTDLELKEGQFTAIVGPSGSGKSTLLHLLGGLDDPTTGAVYVDGQDLYALPEGERAAFRRRNFGFIFQAFHLMPVLTAKENIIMPVLLDGAQPDPVHVNRLHSLLGLSERLNHLPGQLSGGQQQRVAIARADRTLEIIDGVVREG